ncbi:AAA family ATPase [Wolbachia endosymbiont (group A) of Agelastica alni]|uniref:AAA family ATPase n=1 Tax=Wolbachia endosymbiont (group A) of Agelastica alni TaxID=3066130 RepID=UPI00333ED92A
MEMLIVIGGQKGGSGKTTIATNIATMRVMENRDILLYDVDPQRTATLWASRRDEDQNLLRVSSSQKVLDKRTINIGAVIRNELRALQSKYQDIIIDAGGADNEALRAALSLADLAIFPIIPSEFDMWTFETLSNLVASAQRTLNVKVLLNRVSTNPATAKKEIEDCDDFLSDFDNLTRFDSFLSERIAVRRASGKGMAIVEYKPADLKATEEIESVYKEVLSVQ